MSLDWDARDVDQEFVAQWNKSDAELGIGDGDFSTPWMKAQSVIWATISTRIGEIPDEATADEMWIRYVYQSRVLSGHDETYLTRDDFRRMIGLKTNVFPNETRNQFVKRVSEMFFQQQAFYAKTDNETPVNLAPNN